MSMHVRKAAIDAIRAHRKFFVIDAEQVKDGGVQVVAGGDVVHRLVAPVVALAMGDAGFDACTPEPAHEAAAVVIATERTL